MAMTAARQALAAFKQPPGPHTAAIMADAREALIKATSWSKVNDKLRKPAISPRMLANLRKEALAMGIEFPLPAPPATTFKYRPPKGHAFERAKLERLKKIEENMKKMPQMVAEHRQAQRKERQQRRLDKKSFMKTESLF